MAICFNRNSCWPILDHSAQTASSMRRMIKKSTFLVCFPFSNFRYSLTLFSKFFASFPHGTCTLSVFHQYLALDGIYHPLWAAIPSNSTHREHNIMTFRYRREYHPLSCPVPRNLTRCVYWCFYIPQLGTSIVSGCTDSHCELFDFQSPLLIKS